MSFVPALTDVPDFLKPIFKPLRKSIRGRLAIWVIVLSQAQVILLGLMLYFATNSALHSAADNLLADEMSEIAARIRTSGQQSVLNEIVNEKANSQAIRHRYVRILSADNRVLADTPMMPPSLATGLMGYGERLKTPVDIEGASGKFYRAQLFNLEDAPSGPNAAVHVIIATDATYDREAMRSYSQVLVALTLSLIFIGTAVAWAVTTSELRPLDRISAATAAIDTGSLDYRLPRENWPSELQSLVGQINAMLDRLQIAYERLRHYADDVAHEFRNPVNKMLLASEITLSRPRDVEEYREALLSNTEECVRLSRLVNSLLFLARAENAAMALQKSEIDANAELHLLVESFMPLAEEAGVSLECVTDAHVDVEADPVLFHRAVSNLISNAIAHTPRGGSIKVSGEKQVDRVVVRVIDTGEGVPPQARARIFDRFYRSERVRASDTKRVGLGLSIAKRIVELHDGSIYLESELGVGTKVTLYFPTMPQTSVLHHKKIA